MAIKIKVEAADTTRARAQYMTAGIRGLVLNAARSERAVCG